MDLVTRLEKSEQSFEKNREEREHHLQAAEECLTEMTKLQGEYRILQELIKEHRETNTEPTVIEAVPESEDE